MEYSRKPLQFFVIVAVFSFFVFGISGAFSVVGNKESFFLNFSEIFGKIALRGVVGSERNFRGFGILPNKQNAAHFTKRVPLFYACYETYHIIKQGKDGNGMERKRKIKDGHIVVENPLFQELPKHEVTLKSGRTLYRFTGSYDGERSLPHKVLRLMEQEKDKKDVD